MSMNRTLHRLKKAMKDKEYRDSFVEEHIKTGIPFQIRALREKAKWNQMELGQRANMKQERISVLEDPDYSKFTISTLLKLSSAFDVGLTVRFVPFSSVLNEEVNLSETLVPASYDEDRYLHEENEGQAHRSSSISSSSGEDMTFPNYAFSEAALCQGAVTEIRIPDVSTDVGISQRTFLEAI
ncbi:MAG: helix-turn-helix domain-containing protein [Caldithrix sp.]|nr:MAG: helix-turn-helix domain-containing protein [Caldithrix sp.]